MELSKIECELHKRLDYPYRWGRAQADDWDKRTNFIYSTDLFSDLLARTHSFSPELRDYALNRWYNFWSAMAVEYIFATHRNVLANKNKRDKLIDFSINGISFDHKTSIFPKAYEASLAYALEYKNDLIDWLYKHQSQQGRKHLESRLFVVLYDTHQEAHWKMKAEISLLKEQVDKYVENFDRNNLVTLNFGNGEVYADIIWVLK